MPPCHATRAYSRHACPVWVTSAIPGPEARPPRALNKLTPPVGERHEEANMAVIDRWPREPGRACQVTGPAEWFYASGFLWQWVLGEQVCLEAFAVGAGGGAVVVVDEHVALTAAPRVPGPGRVPDAVRVGPSH